MKQRDKLKHYKELSEKLSEQYYAITHELIKLQKKYDKLLKKHNESMIK